MAPRGTTFSVHLNIFQIIVPKNQSPNSRARARARGGLFTVSTPASGSRTQGPLRFPGWTHPPTSDIICTKDPKGTSQPRRANLYSTAHPFFFYHLLTLGLEMAADLCFSCHNLKTTYCRGSLTCKLANLQKNIKLHKMCYF